MTKIIIDGYNLIRQVPELMIHEDESLEAARSALLKRLRAYRKYKPHQITVVFDGKSEMSEAAVPFREAGLTLCYSTSSQKADDVILELIGKSTDDTIVVSSDRFVLQCVRAKGCAIIESVPFYQKMMLALQMEGAGFSSEDSQPKPAHKRWSTFKKGPSKRLPKSQRRNKTRLKPL